jgi:hypothetical protein
MMDKNQMAMKQAQNPEAVDFTGGKQRVEDALGPTPQTSALQTMLGQDRYRLLDTIKDCEQAIAMIDAAFKVSTPSAH